MQATCILKWSTNGALEVGFWSFLVREDATENAYNAPKGHVDVENDRSKKSICLH